MNEKQHVGRPTNEEVAKRKKKKNIKMFLIIFLCFLLVGGIALFLNRNNIDFSSLMGNSATKSYTYFDNNGNGYSLTKEKLGFSTINKCSVSVSKKKNLSCAVYNNGEIVRFQAKKSGTVTVKITGKDSKGKNVKKTIKIIILNDFKSPTCKITTNSKVVKRGSVINAVVTCNEKIKYNKKYFFILGDKKGCSYHNYFINSVKRKNDKSFNIKLTIPNDVCITNDLVIQVYDGVFSDYSNNKAARFQTSVRVTK